MHFISRWRKYIAHGHSSCYTRAHICKIDKLRRYIVMQGCECLEQTLCHLLHTIPGISSSTWSCLLDFQLSVWLGKAYDVYACGPHTSLHQSGTLLANGRMMPCMHFNQLSVVGPPLPVDISTVYWATCTLPSSKKRYFSISILSIYKINVNIIYDTI